MKLTLFDEAFPGLNANIGRCEKIGFPWSSKPFVKEMDGQVVSHVGLLDYPVCIEGKQYSMSALHAICTKATYRGRGYASELIQEALHFAKKNSECVVLYTEIPKFYENLGFRAIQEHRFQFSCPSPKGFKRLIPLTSPHDDALFIRCFQERAPTSKHVWMQDQGQIASFNTLFATYPTYWSLHYSPEFDGIVSFEVKDKTLHLFDVIAKKMPSLELLLDHLPSEIEEVHFYFSPDLFTEAALCTPLICDNSMVDFSGYLMAYGNWPEHKPFMITPLSRC